MSETKNILWNFLNMKKEILASNMCFMNYFLPNSLSLYGIPADIHHFRYIKELPWHTNVYVSNTL